MKKRNNDIYGAYAVITERNHEVVQSFNCKADCRRWIERGLHSTHGSEREHYVSLLAQLNAGRRRLTY